MRIVENNKNKSHKIEVSDIFRGKEHGNFYILSRTDDGYGAIALGDHNGWNYYSSLQRAEDSLQKNVDEGTLIHYSKYDYQLSLEEI